MSHDFRAPIGRRHFGASLVATAAALAVALPTAAEGTSETGGSAEELPSALGAQDPMMRTMQRFVDDLSNGDASMKERIAPTRPRNIAMMAYPGMYPLDLLAPLTVFSDLLNTNVHLVWKTKASIPAGRGVLVQTVAFADCPDSLDALFVPGGTVGTIAALGDDEVLSFLRDRAPKSRFVTSVCTGSLVLAAAGLLDGYRATSHWLVLDLLKNYGATPERRRVVEDRNRITGAGVTAGLDFALAVTARLAGENYAKAEQLNIEYDPHPPFRAGTEEGAGPLVRDAMHRMYASAREGFMKAAKR